MDHCWVQWESPGYLACCRRYIILLSGRWELRWFTLTVSNQVVPINIYELVALSTQGMAWSVLRDLCEQFWLNHWSHWLDLWANLVRFPTFILHQYWIVVRLFGFMNNLYSTINHSVWVSAPLEMLDPLHNAFILNKWSEASTICYWHHCRYRTLCLSIHAMVYETHCSWTIMCGTEPED